MQRLQFVLKWKGYQSSRWQPFQTVMSFFRPSSQKNNNGLQNSRPHTWRRTCLPIITWVQQLWKESVFFQFFKHSKAKQVIYHFNESCNTETSVRKNSSEEKLPPFATKDTFLTTYVYQWDHEGVEIMHRFWRFHAADKQLQGIIWKTESNNSNRHRKVHGCRIWFKEPKTPR